MPDPISGSTTPVRAPETQPVQPPPVTLKPAAPAAIETFPEYNLQDLSIVNMILRLSVTMSKTLQDVMSAKGERLKILNNLLQGWSSAQTNLPRMFTPGDFKDLFPNDGDATHMQNRKDAADRMNQVTARLQDYIRTMKDTVNNTVTQGQQNLQTSLNELSRLSDDFSGMLTMISTFYTKLYK